MRAEWVSDLGLGCLLRAGCGDEPLLVYDIGIIFFAGKIVVDILYLRAYINSVPRLGMSDL